MAKKPPKSWTVTKRLSGLIEWCDPDGVGHPAPLSEQPKHIRNNWDKNCYGVHGCNGKCRVYKDLWNKS